MERDSKKIMYGSSSLAKPKVGASEIRLNDLDPFLKFEIYTERLSLENAPTLFSKYDVIADEPDNFATRCLVNDASYSASRPLIAASVLGFRAAEVSSAD